MKLKIGVFNVKWMRRLFDRDWMPNTSGAELERSIELKSASNHFPLTAVIEKEV